MAGFKSLERVRVPAGPRVLPLHRPSGPSPLFTEWEEFDDLHQSERDEVLQGVSQLPDGGVSFLESLTVHWLRVAQHHLNILFQIRDVERPRYEYPATSHPTDEQASKLIFPAWAKSHIHPRACAEARAWRSVCFHLTQLIHGNAALRTQALQSIYKWKPPSLRSRSAAPMSQGSAASTVAPGGSANGRDATHVSAASTVARAPIQFSPPATSLAEDLDTIWIAPDIPLSALP